MVNGNSDDKCKQTEQTHKQVISEKSYVSLIDFLERQRNFCMKELLIFFSIVE